MKDTGLKTGATLREESGSLAPQKRREFGPEGFGMTAGEKLPATVSGGYI
jgi:hypothetical protein